MATTFGTQPGDVVTDRKGNVLEGIFLSLYGSRADALAPKSAITTVSTDHLGAWAYTDPSSRNVLYIRDPSGRVWAVEAEEFSTGTPTSGLAGLPAGATFAVYWDGTSSTWKYAGNTVTSRPSARADLTMIAIGGAVGPSFGQVGVDIWLRDA